MIKNIVTREGIIFFPAHGSLKELHAVLIGDLKWLGGTVTINGWGYCLTETGFQSNDSTRIYHPDDLGKGLHRGMAIISSCVHDPDEEIPPYYEIITTGRIAHISKRCKMCGDQLYPKEKSREVCNSCYASEVQ